MSRDAPVLAEDALDLTDVLADVALAELDQLLALGDVSLACLELVLAELDIGEEARFADPHLLLGLRDLGQAGGEGVLAVEQPPFALCEPGLALLELGQEGEGILRRIAVACTLTLEPLGLIAEPCLPGR